MIRRRLPLVKAVCAISGKITGRDLAREFADAFPRRDAPRQFVPIRLPWRAIA